MNPREASCLRVAVPYNTVLSRPPRQTTVEAEQVNVVHVSSFSGKVVFSKTKAEYGNASRVITWRILYLCFGLGFTTASIKT